MSSKHNRVKVDSGCEIGDLLAVQHGPKDPDTYYRVTGFDDDGAPLLLFVPRREAEMEIEGLRRQARLNALCADAIRRRQ